MHRLVTAFLVLLLPLANVALAADTHVERITGWHVAGATPLAGNTCSPEEGEGEHAPHCHHCCHAQGHFYSLPQTTREDRSGTDHDWTVLATARPLVIGRAPPVPPPKA